MLEVLGGKIKMSFVALLLTFPVAEFVLSSDEVKIAWILMLALILDSILGVSNALIKRSLASWRMGQPFAKKFILYGIAMITALLMGSSHVGFSWVFEYLGVYFILSEVLSIFEKLALLGLKLPQKLVSRVNEVFESYVLGDKQAAVVISQKRP